MPSPRASRSLSTPPAVGGADGAGKGEAAQRSAREAEELLREALRRQSERRQPPDRGLHASSTHRCDLHPDESCMAYAVGNLCQSFLLSYGVRVGVGILLRAFKLARGHSYSSLLDLKQLVSEKDLIVREEACRIGLLFGGFTGSYHALRCLLRRMRKRERPSDVVLAGMVAGLSILALDDSSRRRTLALYLLARLSQCAYNSAKSKNKFHFWGSQWGHGDSLLFALACSQVMYAFVMRPESLPKAYQDFIQKTGPVAEPVYKAVRECCRGGPVDIVSLSAFLHKKKGFSSIKLEEYPSLIPCSIIHPGTSSCLVQNVNAVSATFRKTFPLYFSLTFVPFVVLHLQKRHFYDLRIIFLLSVDFFKSFVLTFLRKISPYPHVYFAVLPGRGCEEKYIVYHFMQSPALTCWNAVKAAIRSTTFISAFVGIFQAVICFHRNVSSKDHKLVYWLAGGMAGASVLFEKKNRRSELALYVLPRAGDSLWNILVNRRLLPNVKNAEVALFCLCMGGIMYYLEYEPDTMAPFLRGLIRRFLASRISNPDPPSSQDTMYPYIQPDGSLGIESESQEKLDKGITATREKYDLEAIPGL